MASWRKRFAEESLALHISAAVALFGLVIAGAAALSGYWSLSRQLDVRLVAELEGKRALMLHVLSEIASVEQIPANGHRFGDLLIGHKDLHLALIDVRHGRVLASFSRVAMESVTRVKSDAVPRMTRWQSKDVKHYVSLSGESPVRDTQAVKFVLSIDLEDDQAMLGAYINAVLLGLPVLLALITFGAWAVAWTGLAPLKRLTAVTSQVTTRNLTQRIDVQHLPLELRVLAEGFNAMLARVDEGVQHLSDFSADLAHEMRTPVATLLGRTQVALTRPRSVDELHDVLVGNVDELERLTRLIADMLFLAQSDRETAALDCSVVDLTQESLRVAEFLSVVSEERQVSVEVEGSATVHANRILVQRAITNLLTNAIRHADANSVVSVVLRQAGGTTFLDVSNGGPNILPNQLERVFERFLRLDPARARADGGTGLGLAIVKSVMCAHGGSVHVSSEAGGLTTFTLAFPPAVSNLQRNPPRP